MHKTSSSVVTSLLLALIAAPVLLLAEPNPASDVIRKLPEAITPVTKEQLNTKIPHFYCFEYQGYPQPGKRYWIRVDDKTWIERYPDGLESKFRIIGRTKVKDADGTILVKISGDEEATTTDNAGGLQVFIPDKGSSVMHHWYRNTARGDGDWNDLAEMQSVE